MAWFWLVLAGALEVVWAFSMKQSNGFTKPVPTLITLATLTASFILLSLSLKSIPLGTAYPIWTGIGALGAFAVGVVVFDEPATARRLIAVGLLLLGVVLLKWSEA
ncbi:MAG: multidrug efflux SMR transporter [Myxococcota bacterium]|jgi:quaternary ammonium compound-resistance protein SugE|nr:multidrug efflux SMR transporter [Myxococcota bacterium]